MTGGYAGIGYELSRILYERNATVYLTGRSPGKASKAIAALREQVPSSQGRLEFLLLDLADLTTTRSAAVEFMARESRLDVLVNNAGVADVSPEMRTQQVSVAVMWLVLFCLVEALISSLLIRGWR